MDPWSGIINFIGRLNLAARCTLRLRISSANAQVEFYDLCIYIAIFGRNRNYIYKSILVVYNIMFFLTFCASPS